jgi:hypothetical protein
MAENYFPRAEDFDEMGDHLEMIAKILNDKIDTSDWASIQKAVRTGVAPEILPVGTQLVANHSVYGEIKLDVVAHDHYETANVKRGHSMTLMCHDVITSIRFDEPEAFYYADEELPVGTYHFFVLQGSSAAGQFTLDQPLAKGGQLHIYGNPDYSIDSSEILAYDYPTSQTVPRTYAITVGNNGTCLGTLGVELNSKNRALYGSNNYKESSLRQFVNNSSPAGKVWTPQTKFDFRPQWAGVLAGFADGLDIELKKVIGRVKVPCRNYSNYESPDSTITPSQKYTLTDEFYIPSGWEMSGVGAPGNDGSKGLPYFEDFLNADRIKYSGAYACKYWLRGDSEHLNKGACVNESGKIIAAYPSESLGVVPMFNIV